MLRPNPNKPRQPIYFPTGFAKPLPRKRHKLAAAAGASARKRSSDNTKKQKAKTSEASAASAVSDQCIHGGARVTVTQQKKD
jgi:hypothetical protein